MVIVYRSNTGFTREYAEMLGRAEKIKVYSVTEAEALPLWPAGAGNHLQSQLCAKRPYFLFAGGLGP